MEIHNQIFYTTLCSCILSLTGWSEKFTVIFMLNVITLSRTPDTNIKELIYVLVILWKIDPDQ